jgi:hypothetical protein
MASVREGPLLRSQDGMELVAVRDDGGRVYRLASARLSEVAVHDRAPPYVAWGDDLLRFSLPVMILAALLMSWLVRKVRRKAPVPNPSPFFRRLGTWTSWATWLMMPHCLVGR